MALYFFRIRNGQYSGMSAQGTELADREAAWTELTHVCADIVGSISRKLKQNSEWEMELLDESRQPVFRLRLVAETINPGLIEHKPVPQLLGRGCRLTSVTHNGANRGKSASAVVKAGDESRRDPEIV
jgi:hypothetical protein